MQGLHVAVGQTFGHGLDGLTSPIEHESAQVALAPGSGVLTRDGRKDLGAERVEVLTEFFYSCQVHPPMMAQPEPEIRNLTKYY